MFASFAVCPLGRVASSGASLCPCHADLRLGRVACVAWVPLCHGDCCWAGRVGAAVPWGSASRARRVCGVCGAVPWGLLQGVSRGCRCAMGIAGGRVAWVALCHGDCCWAGRVGAAVPWGFPLCHGDCCSACRVGGAVPWGLLLGGSRGCRCAMRIAAWRVAWVRIGVGRVAWVPPCLGPGPRSGASTGGSRSVREGRDKQHRRPERERSRETFQPAALRGL